MHINIKKIIDFRQKLHKFPELSGKEANTVQKIIKFISPFQPDKIYTQIGGNGLAIEFTGSEKGKTIIFRAELDALPIDETNSKLPYRSAVKGVSHKCGHDGHIAILTALAEAISYDRPKKGRIILLFQPEEETLTGAVKILNDPQFNNLEPDIIIGFHNVPEYPINTLIVKDKNFTAATNGIKITFKGKKAHAAYPFEAISPTEAVEKILKFIRYDIYTADFKDKILITLTFLNIGTPNMGITPDNAQIWLVIRSYEYEDLDKAISLIRDYTEKIAKQFNLQYKIQFSDDAPPIYNDPNLTNSIINIAKQTGFNVIEKKEPFLWAEDFGYYTIKYKGVYFALGNGLKTQLHSENYDFPDAMLYDAALLMYNIYKHFQN